MSVFINKTTNISGKVIFGTTGGGGGNYTGVPTTDLFYTDYSIVTKPFSSYAIAAGNNVYVLPNGDSGLIFVDATNDTGESKNYGETLNELQEGVYVPDTDEVWAFNHPDYSPSEVNPLIIDNAGQTASFVTITNSKAVYNAAYVDSTHIVCHCDGLDVIFNPTARTATQVNLGLTLSSYTMHTAANGKVYCVPDEFETDDPDIIIIDPSVPSFTATKMGIDFVNDVAQFGAVAFGKPAEYNGKLVYPPLYSSKILIIDTSNDTATISDYGLADLGEGVGYGSKGFVLGDDDLMYSVTNSGASTFLIYDPVIDDAYYNTLGLTSPVIDDVYASDGAVKTTNGKIHAWDNVNDQMLIIDTSA